MKSFVMGSEPEDAPTKPLGNLTIELVPSSSWGDNLRSRLKQSQWDMLRKKAYAAANHQCEICGGKGTNQGYNWPVECHEVWDYDDTKHVQKLVRLIALCPRCHQVKHFGLAQMRGQGERALQHLGKVNGWTKAAALEHSYKALAKWSVRSQQDWHLDLSHLSQYGIDLA